MRIKDEIFCFAHLRWCHNGWASNILIVVDTGYAGIHHSEYWMPIHYDTIEDGQNKKSHLLFCNRFPFCIHIFCQQFLDYLENDAMVIEIWGKQKAGNSKKSSSANAGGPWVRNNIGNFLTKIWDIYSDSTDFIEKWKS